MSSEAIEIIRRALDARRMSRAQLADQARISLDTLNKCLSGKRELTPRILIPVGQVLGVAFERPPVTTMSPVIAPEALGAYTRVGVRWLEKRYLSLRPAFQRDCVVLASALDIHWSDEEGCLVYLQRPSFQGPVIARGKVSISTQSGHISLVASTLGHFELTILARPAEDGRLQGIVTMYFHRRDVLIPGCGPLVLVPIADSDPTTPFCGEIDRDHSRYGQYSRLLEMVELQGFAKFAAQIGL